MEKVIDVVKGHTKVCVHDPETSPHEQILATTAVRSTMYNFCDLLQYYAFKPTLSDLSYMCVASRHWSMTLSPLVRPAQSFHVCSSTPS